MRQAAKRDFVEATIVAALERIGVTVVRISQEGVPDLLTYRAGQWFPIEVKSPGGTLTPAQQALYDVAPFPVVETVEAALSLFGVFYAGPYVPPA